MLIKAVDQDRNLFRIEGVFSQDMVKKVLTTPWLDLDWIRQEGQESWARRKIKDSAIPWIDQWHREFRAVWHKIAEKTQTPMKGYIDTAFWVDEPGFTCGMHTDGSMPGSVHLTWIGAGTTFYWYKNSDTVRYQTPSYPNSGYIMINRVDETGYQRLLWHDMPYPVPQNSFRLTTYSWIDFL